MKENIKIIIVDDELEIRNALAELLESHLKKKIPAFPSADDTLSYLKDNKTDVIISDIGMPGTIDGLGLLKEVKKRWPKTLFISMSGNLEYTAKQILELGADAFFFKPVRAKDLIQAIEKLLP